MTTTITGATGVNRVADGADMPAGSVIQVIYGSTSTEVANTSSSWVDTGLSATITPTSTSSNILIIQSSHFFDTNASGAVGFTTQLLRGSSSIKEFAYPIYNAGTVMAQASASYLDSPSTTSATTYKMQYRNVVGTTNIIAQYDDSNGDSVSTMILMEIAQWAT